MRTHSKEQIQAAITKVKGQKKVQCTICKQFGHIHNICPMRPKELIQLDSRPGEEPPILYDDGEVPPQDYPMQEPYRTILDGSRFDTTDASIPDVEQLEPLMIPLQWDSDPLMIEY